MKYFLGFLKLVSVIFFALSLIVNLFFGGVSIYHIVTSISNGTYGVESSYCDMSAFIMVIWGLLLLVTDGVATLTSIAGFAITYAEKQADKKFFGIILIASLIGGLFFYVVSTLYMKM